MSVRPPPGNCTRTYCASCGQSLSSGPNASRAVVSSEQIVHASDELGNRLNVVLKALLAAVTAVVHDDVDGLLCGAHRSRVKLGLDSSDEAQKFLPSSLCAAVFVADAAGVHCPKVVLELVSENTCSGIDICCQ